MKYELINHESSIGAFFFIALCLIYFVITFTYHSFLALVEYQP
jgi:hypothetical protein